MMDQTPNGATVRPLSVERWPSETPLFVVVLFVSLAIWAVLALSIVGLIYVVLIAVFFFISHLVFIVHLRGSAVRLGPDQLPELHRRVEHLAQELGLRRVPAVYAMQAGGALNALATRFLATDFIVLFTDLLDACGDDAAARDMIIGHELGHIKEGHLRWLWILLPGLFVPFLGTAYSQAREYTCDRYGAAVCGTRRAAVRGLAILAAGGNHGRRIDHAAFARQCEDLDSGWMTIGRWLATHPPLTYRVSALDPGLTADRRSPTRGPISALMILTAVFLLPVAAAVVLSLAILPMTREVLAVAEQAPATEPDPVEAYPTAASMFGEAYARDRVSTDLQRLAVVVEEYLTRTGHLPSSMPEVALVWGVLRAGEIRPTDPFDGFDYGYGIEDRRFVIWSAGPDPESPEDDIRFVSRVIADTEGYELSATGPAR